MDAATAAALPAIWPVTARTRAPEWDAVLLPPEADSPEGLGEATPAVPARPLATSAEDQTTLRETARLRL